MPLDSTGYLSPTSYGEKDILFHRPTDTEQEQANSAQSVRARRAVDEDGEVLRKAAELIEQGGWWDGCSETASESHCIVTALVAVRGLSRGMEYKRMGFGNGNDAAAWNDTPGRTKQEVIARLRSAAEQRA